MSKIEVIHNIGHLRRTALAVSTEAPPTYSLNLLFPRSSQSEGRWVKKKKSCRATLVESINKNVQTYTLMLGQ